MKRIVVLTGAGVSAESGIKTFRDSGGLWEEYCIEDVATPQAWQKNQALVLDFYNQRRKQVLEALPNAAHKALVDLEEKYIVNIITQNIDDLHERAGSSNVMHLHGEIRKSRSSKFSHLIYDINGWELKAGDNCEKGAQLRPHIVWFGEQVPMMEKAVPFVEHADVIIVIGTSLEVYPAAGLLMFASDKTEKFLVDPHASPQAQVKNIRMIRDTAGNGVPALVNELLKR